MREKKNYRIITFHTTSAAMAMEKYCGENHINGRLIPVPKLTFCRLRSCVADGTGRI